MPAIITMQMPISRYHGRLQFLLTQMPISCYLGCLQFFLMRMPANLAHAEGGDFTNSVYRSFLASRSTSYFLASMRRWTCLPAPTILGTRGSLRCVGAPLGAPPK
ncbi:hypothetical protein AZE42_05016 [Rhizopogon vesiculosus]|uniref:Uncharacterized protein n=1 Tax=Rhizopogon vesiculosus TaxID=180088 RepID=A0A1J8PXV1_9AGAM|nr:hypothetical protein AZE42_05016 [Rhizopogon vesiculosus]